MSASNQGSGGTFNWSGSGGSWNVTNNWNLGSKPKNAGDVAVLGGSLAVAATVTLDGHQKAGRLDFRQLELRDDRLYAFIRHRRHAHLGQFRDHGAA